MLNNLKGLQSLRLYSDRHVNKKPCSSINTDCGRANGWPFPETNESLTLPSLLWPPLWVRTTTSIHFRRCCCWKKHILRHFFLTTEVFWYQNAAFRWKYICNHSYLMWEWQCFCYWNSPTIQLVMGIIGIGLCSIKKDWNHPATEENTLRPAIPISGSLLLSIIPAVTLWPWYFALQLFMECCHAPSTVQAGGREVNTQASPVLLVSGLQ